MKTESFLKVINSRQWSIHPDEYWRRFCRRTTRAQQIVNFPRKYLKRLVVFNGARWEMRRWTSRPNGKGHSDLFWADEAIKYYPDFRIAPVEVGLKFAFEVAPRLCFELNNRHLPFGCHAWPRYDREFWEPYLLKG
jgi:hypothetical protein